MATQCSHSNCCGSFDSCNMCQRKLYTLVFVRHNAQVLLGLKKRGFGEGRWNGFGGKVEVGETVRHAAARELEEESGVTAPADKLDFRGHLEFYFAGQPTIMEVKVFTVPKILCKGEPKETEEMRPLWYHLDGLPTDRMWPDDKFWFPYLVNESYFIGKFWFEGHDLIVKHELRGAGFDEIKQLLKD